MRLANIRSHPRVGWGWAAPLWDFEVGVRFSARVLVLAALAAAALLPGAAVAERSDEVVEVDFASTAAEVVYTVTLDTGASGRTPCTLAVQPGWRRLAVLHEGGSYEQDLFVWAGTRGMVWVGRDEAVPATLLRLGFPEARAVLVDGAAVCESPCALLLAPGRHELEVAGQFKQRLFIRRNRQLRLDPGEKPLRVEAEPGPLPFSGPRLRLGGGVEWAPFAQLVHGDQESLMAFEAQVRLGAQFTENLAVYLQASAMVGNTLRGPSCDWSSCTSQTNYWLPFLGAGTLVEATFWHRLQVALGPTLIWALHPVGLGGSNGSMGGGGILRVDGVPGPNPTSRRRRGVTVGLQGQFGLFPGGSLWGVGIAVGYDVF